MKSGGKHKSRWCQATALVVGAMLTSAVTGCGNSLAKVSGVVSIDGEPIVGGENVRATVYFYPEGGTGAPAIGLLNGQGRYEIATGSKTGVEPGAYVVTISATEIILPKQQGEAPSGRPLTARKYANPKQSGFRVEVEPGGNVFDFDLESQVARRRSG